ncbi:MAG: TlpA family protein disulfide reductase, partial [Acidobacteria bacterium]
AGGPAGRGLAPWIGRRPIVALWWRPGDALSERALVETVETAARVAPDAVLAPVAVLASGQAPSEVATRIAALGVRGVEPLVDSGALARLLGVRELPSFVLIDAGGVLRLVGGGSVGQQAADGTTIAEAIALAGKGRPVPTLGVLQANPVFAMVGRPLPDVRVARAGTGEPVALRSLLEPGKRLLVFYWLPTCPHCKTSLPVLREWVRLRAPDDLVVVDIAQAASETLERQAVEFIAPFPWQHLVDRDRSAGRALRVRDTPSVFLVAPDGEILGIRVGAGIDWDRWLGR